MADSTIPGNKPKKPKSAKPKSAPKPRKTVAKKGAAKETVPVTNTSTTPSATDTAATATSTSPHREEAKSRFSAAVQEAKAGAAALRAEASEKASAYKAQAYGEEAKAKGHELAVQGKAKLSEGIATLGQMVNDNAHYVDEKVGAKYGDYARSASRSLSDTAAKLDAKSVDELAEDGRAMVRRSPATAVGIAAVAGFMLSRLFSRR